MLESRFRTREVDDHGIHPDPTTARHAGPIEVSKGPGDASAFSPVETSSRREQPSSAGLDLDEDHEVGAGSAHEQIDLVVSDSKVSGQRQVPASPESTFDQSFRPSPGRFLGLLPGVSRHRRTIRPVNGPAPRAAKTQMDPRPGRWFTYTGRPARLRRHEQ